MFGHECPNCGMLEFACVCVPWCWKHDRQRPCEPCEKEPKAPEPAVYPETMVAIIIVGALAILGMLYCVLKV
jgi:hypothetical protein